jgi:hypothetical protein
VLALTVTVSVDQVGTRIDETIAVITTTAFMHTVDEKLHAATQKFKDNL